MAGFIADFPREAIVQLNADGKLALRLDCGLAVPGKSQSIPNPISKLLLSPISGLFEPQP